VTQHDPALLSAALAGIERALNQAIALSPTSHGELAELAGTVLGVEVTTFDLTVYLDIISGTEARLLTHCELPTAAFVRGTVEDFASLASSKDPAAVLINSGIELEGNSASLIALQQVISRMDIDWEAPLVATLGDVMGPPNRGNTAPYFSLGRRRPRQFAATGLGVCIRRGALNTTQSRARIFF
jgi:ubiquinone biosynthesis protein UbiJ